MKAMNELRKRKAISPVIATVILVAVAITISVAVSYWMGSIASQYTSFEKVEMTVVCKTGTSGGWDIAIKLKNSGPKTATITTVFVNDMEVPDSDLTPPLLTGLKIESGETKDVVVHIAPVPLTSGTTVTIEIHSASGMEYFKMVRLT